MKYEINAIALNQGRKIADLVKELIRNEIERNKGGESK